MPSYSFDNRGWFEKEVELATLRSVEVAPSMIPNYPREVGKAWLMLNPLMDSWRIVAYEEPPAPIEIKPVGISKGEFADLFGFPKLTEIAAVAQNDIEVKTAWDYGMMYDQIVVDHPKTLALLSLLGIKNLLTKEQIEMISSNQEIW